jgi:hypothetical protein
MEKMKKFHLLFIFLYSLSFIFIKYSSDSNYFYTGIDIGLSSSDEKSFPNHFYVNKGKFIAINSTGTFPLPDAIQLRSIVILIFGSIPIGVLFLILLYRSRKRRKLK